MTEQETASTFVEQAKRHADPVRRRNFAVERTQSALKCSRSHAEGLVDALDAPSGDPQPEAPEQAPVPAEAPETAAQPPARPSRKRSAKKVAPPKQARPRLGKKKR